MERFFNGQRRKATDEDHFAIIRRIDLDADSKINKDEFLEAIKPQEPYSKMVVRARVANRGPREPIGLKDTETKKKQLTAAKATEVQAQRGRSRQKKEDLKLF